MAWLLPRPLSLNGLERNYFLQLSLVYRWCTQMHLFKGVQWSPLVPLNLIEPELYCAERVADTVSRITVYLSVYLHLPLPLALLYGQLVRVLIV